MEGKKVLCVPLIKRGGAENGHTEQQDYAQHLCGDFAPLTAAVTGEMCHSLCGKRDNETEKPRGLL